MPLPHFTQLVVAGSPGGPGTTPQEPVFTNLFEITFVLPTILQSQGRDPIIFLQQALSIDLGPTNVPIATAEQVLNAITGAISAEPIASGSRGLTEPDKYGHWSASELELVTVRTVSFVSRGVSLTDADVLACHLVERDRTFDDRRSCAECLQLARGRCRLGLQPFGGGGVEVLHRCSEFKEP